MNADGWNASPNDRIEYFTIEEILKIVKRKNFLEVLILWKEYLIPTWEPLPFVYHTEEYKKYRQTKLIVSNYNFFVI